MRQRQRRAHRTAATQIWHQEVQNQLLRVFNDSGARRPGAVSLETTPPPSYPFNAPCDFLSARKSFSYSTLNFSRLLSPTSSLRTCVAKCAERQRIVRTCREHAASRPPGLSVHASGERKARLQTAGQMLQKASNAPWRARCAAARRTGCMRAVSPSASVGAPPGTPAPARHTPYCPRGPPPPPLCLSPPSRARPGASGAARPPFNAVTALHSDAMLLVRGSANVVGV